jgi:hypothetical protein
MFSLLMLVILAKFKRRTTLRCLHYLEKIYLTDENHSADSQDLSSFDTSTIETTDVDVIMINSLGHAIYSELYERMTSKDEGIVAQIKAYLEHCWSFTMETDVGDKLLLVLGKY